MSSRQVVGSWKACRDHDKVLRKMMRQRMIAMSKSAENRVKEDPYKELCVVAVSAPINVESGAKLPNQRPNQPDRFDARSLMEVIKPQSESKSSRLDLDPELNYDRYRNLVLGELQEVDADDIIQQVEGKLVRDRVLVPTQEELQGSTTEKKKEGSAVPHDYDSGDRKEDATQQKERQEFVRAEANKIGDAFGIEDFWVVHRRNELDEREKEREKERKEREEKELSSMSKKDRKKFMHHKKDRERREREDFEEREEQKKRRSGRRRASPSYDPMFDASDSSDGGMALDKALARKFKDSMEQEEKLAVEQKSKLTALTPKQMMEKMLADQLHSKIEADQMHEKKIAAAAESRWLERVHGFKEEEDEFEKLAAESVRKATERGEPDNKKSKKEKKKEKKKKGKKDKKKTKKRSSKEVIDPLEIALEGLKKKHNLT